MAMWIKKRNDGMAQPANGAFIYEGDPRGQHRVVAIFSWSHFAAVHAVRGTAQPIMLRLAGDTSFELDMTMDEFRAVLPKDFWDGYGK